MAMDIDTVIENSIIEHISPSNNFSSCSHYTIAIMIIKLTI